VYVFDIGGTVILNSKKETPIIVITAVKNGWVATISKADGTESFVGSSIRDVLTMVVEEMEYEGGTAV
jgi:hypothetical protein